MQPGDHGVYIDEAGRPTKGLVIDAQENGEIVTLLTLHPDLGKRQALTSSQFQDGLTRIFSVPTIERKVRDLITAENEAARKAGRDAVAPEVTGCFGCIVEADMYTVVGTGPTAAAYPDIDFDPPDLYFHPKPEQPLDQGAIVAAASAQVAPVPPPPNPVPPAGTELVSDGGQVVGVSDGDQVVPVEPQPTSGEATAPAEPTATSGDLTPTDGQ